MAHKIQNALAADDEREVRVMKGEVKRSPSETIETVMIVAGEMGKTD